jgi:CRISPR-associated protein Csx10
MFELTATAEQPVTIGFGGDGMRRPTERYVPGSAVRGAFAAGWLAEHGDYSTSAELRWRFTDLFERPGARFSPLIADGAGPASLAELRHKYRAHPGCGRVSWNAAVEPDAEGMARCPDCAQPLEYAKGEIIGPRVADRVRVALTDRETAEQGALFARESLVAGTVLRGHITSDEPWLGRVARIRIGGKRSTSGAVTLRVAPVDAPPLPTVSDGGRVVVVWLAGPAVFVDSAGRPVDRPADDELGRLLGVPSRVERSWVRQTRVGGWHLASGLPKPVELAVRPGSTFRVRCTEPVPAEGLRRLVTVGLGLRRNEGLGWVGPLPGPEDPTAGLEAAL